MKRYRFRKIIVAITMMAAVLMNSSITDIDVSAAARNITQQTSSRYTRLTQTRTYGYGDAGGYKSLPFEGYFGFKLTTEGNTVTIAPYSHSRIDAGTVCHLSLYKGSTLISDIGDYGINQTAAVTVSDPGEYIVAGTFNRDDYKVYGYLVNDGTRVLTARLDSVSASAQSTWDQFTQGWNPSGSEFTSNANVTYPTSGSNGRVVQVEEWEKHSDDIVRNTGEQNVTNAYKVFMFVKDLTNNYAYDDYRANTLGGLSRASVANDWHNDQLFMYYDHVGTCWDFVNAFSIMCRHHGIPCTSVEDGYHTWNAVYLNGEWVAIDITNMLRYHCSTEDTSSSKWKTYSVPYLIDDYGVYRSGPYYGLSIWNYANMKKSTEVFGSPSLR